MTTDETTPVDWKRWLERWDAQQTGYVPRREERFRVMLDAVAALLPEDFVALDLACGPGAISQRLLERFPLARAVAIDFDPVMLAIGRGALGTYGDRLRWVDFWEPVREVIWFKRPVYVQALAELGPLLHPGGVPPRPPWWQPDWESAADG